MKYLLQRYIGGMFVVPFLMSSIFFVSFLLIFQLFRITKWIINKGVAVSTVLELMSHIAISFLPMAIPLSALFASIYCLRRLSDDSEILVMRSIGLNKYQLFAPFLLAGIVISLMVFGLGQSIIPASNKAFKLGVLHLTSKGVLADIKKGQFFTEIPNITLYAKEVQDEGKDLFDLFIHIKNEEKKEEKIIFAKKGRLHKDVEDKWGGGDLNLHLSDGNIVKINSMEQKLEKIFFSEYEFPILKSSLGVTLSSRLAMKTLQELHYLINLAPAERKKILNDKDYIKLKLEYWSRFNNSLICFVFILLGFSIGIQRVRGKGTNLGLVCLIILVGYYSLHFTSISLAKHGSIPPLLAIFLPTLIVKGVGLKYFFQLDWV